MGLDTYKISMDDVFGANRRKLVQAIVVRGHDMMETVTTTASSISALVYLEGGRSETRNDTDHEPIFRQESYFLWLTGVMDPDCAVAIETTTGRTTLFVPKVPQSYATIMGHILTLDEWKHKYQVDCVQFTDDTESYLHRLLFNTDDQQHQLALLVMHGTNSDSGNVYPAPIFKSEIMKEHSIDTTTLFPILAECRVIKSEYELNLLEHVAYISSMAHVYTMRHTKPFMMEYQCESLFRHYGYFNFGSRLVGYTPICGCGPNSSILHYGHAGEPNNRQIQPNDMLLMDMGAEYFGYGSDITCSYPASGIFTEKQAGIYTAVLNAQKAVWAMIRPGVSWVDCHKAAERAILTQLVHLGVVMVEEDPCTTTIENLVDMRLGAIFMPHGLGHFIGIDTHDVGGYLPGHPERIQQPGLKSLRTARILKESMVLTNEPGCYFIDWLLDEALASPVHSKFLNADVLKEYRGFGGVRLEDVFCVTSNGFYNFTMCPRTISEVEHCMAGGKWPPLADEAPELGRKHLTDPTRMPPSSIMP